MKIAVHDFSGHPFQAQLSRELSSRGIRTDHVYAAEYVGGKGDLHTKPGDPEGLSFTVLSAAMSLQKYSLFARLRYEWRYGRAWIKYVKTQKPDAVVMCNVPLVSLFMFAFLMRRQPWVFWHQDIYSFGIAAELHRQIPKPLAVLGAWVFEWMEAFSARRASHMVAIGDAFTEVYPRWKVPTERVSVIPNWAPLDTVFPTPKDNPKSKELFNDEGGTRLLYAGTLGRKHNPDLLLELVRQVSEMGGSTQLTVVSEGEAADDVAAAAQADASLQIRVLGFQPAADLPHVLGSADAVVALLEPDATRFSIPSKVLSYMAAGRPIIGLMPEDNPAASDIKDSGGFVSTPDVGGATAAAAWVVEVSGSTDALDEIGQRARAIAEEKFEITAVGDRFEGILRAAVSSA